MLNSSRPLQDLKEKAAHGDIFLPIMKYTSYLTLHSPTVPIHWHEEMEWTRIVSGSARYQIALNDYEVRAGDLILIQPHLLHSVLRQNGRDMCSETFVFHLNFLGGTQADSCFIKYFAPLLSGALSVPCILRPDDPCAASADSLFSSMLSCYLEAGPGYELGLKALLFELFSLLFSRKLVTRTDQTAANTVQSEKLKEILQYISLHFTQELTVEEAADACHLSPSYFMHFFKDNAGMTFKKYLNACRLRHAAALLEKEGCTIIDAAFSSGFHNISYFHKRFREYYGMTPKQFTGSLERLKEP